MKSLIKCGLLMAVIGTALMFAVPQRAEARRYYSYYPAYPAYGPVYTAYYPRRAAYPRPRPRRVAYYGAPVVYSAPAYPVYYAPAPAPWCCN